MTSDLTQGWVTETETETEYPYYRYFPVFLVTVLPETKLSEYRKRKRNKNNVIPEFFRVLEFFSPCLHSNAPVLEKLEADTYLHTYQFCGMRLFCLNMQQLFCLNSWSVILVYFCSSNVLNRVIILIIFERKSTVRPALALLCGKNDFHMDFTWNHFKYKWKWVAYCEEDAIHLELNCRLNVFTETNATGSTP